MAEGRAWNDRSIRDYLWVQEDYRRDQEIQIQQERNDILRDWGRNDRRVSDDNDYYEQEPEPHSGILVLPSLFD